jgi:hypothetical protein
VPLSDFVLGMRRWLPWSLIGLGVALPALAQDCPGARISFRGSRWRPELSERVQAELRVELERAELCSGGSSTAEIDFIWEGREPLGLSVTLQQGKSARTVARRLDPHGLPPDGLALVLAEVTGELLAEARAVVKPPPPPPPPVERPKPAPPPAREAPKVVEPLPLPPAPRSWTLGLEARAAGEGWSGGQLQGGGDAAFRWSLARLSAEAVVGGRAALVRNVDGGSVHAQSLLFGGGAGFAVLRRAPWELAAQAELLGGPEWASSQARAGWLGVSGHGWILAGRAGAELAWRWAGARWALAAGLDVPLRGLALNEGAQPIEAVTGLGAYCALGGGWVW